MEDECHVAAGMCFQKAVSAWRLLLIVGHYDVRLELVRLMGVEGKRMFPGRRGTYFY